MILLRRWNFDTFLHFQHMKDKFWNFVFYKFIFVFGVVNVQYLNEVRNGGGGVLSMDFYPLDTQT